MRVGCVVVTYNSAESIGRCLSSLQDESLVSEVVVIDNASSDETIRLVPHAYLTTNEGNVGFAKGVNQGVSKLSPDCEAILLLNPDAWLTDGALPRMLEALESSDSVGGVGPRNVYEDGVTAPTGWRFPNPWVSLALNMRLGRLLPASLRRRWLLSFYLPTEGLPVEVDWVFGACVLFRRRMWEQLGGFDESFFMFGEELDLFWRASKRGWECLFVPEAVIMHVGGLSARAEYGSAEYLAKQYARTREVARRHMSNVSYRLWLPVQQFEEWRYRRGLQRQS